MKKSSEMSLRSRSTVFPSTVVAKDGSQLQVSSGRGYGSSAALLPLGNRRSVPSKWDDAEKWICSPVSDGLVFKNSELPVQRRRQKSKSGPLGPRCVGGGGETYLTSSFVSLNSDDGRARTFTTNSPVMRDDQVEDGGFCDRRIRGRVERVDGFDVWDGRSHHGQSVNCGQQESSVPVPGWSELLMEASSYLPTSQEEQPQIVHEVTRLSDVLRKDVGTQMSPVGSTCSSPDVKKQALTIGELHKHFSKLEVRDVQVDDQVTMKRWSKRHSSRISGTSNAKQCKKRTAEAGDSSWKVARARKHLSKKETEEARIIAWENLQKAKAEAAVRELEMRLEKERASSMDKIMNKLSSAQRKAEEMRKSVTAHQAAKAPRKATLLQRINRLHLFHGCFINHTDTI